jgi:hypothetical protein
MITNLWNSNTPERFWLCQPAVSQDHWEAAIREAAPLLGLPVQPEDTETLLALVLGEGQFGPDHWRLGPSQCLYYVLKPALPRPLVHSLRRLYRPVAKRDSRLGWPIEPRYALFQWEVMRRLLIATGEHSLSFVHFWPEGHRFAFVLTHDIETADGQAYVRTVADLDDSFGFRSSFNFVSERYPINYDLLDELRDRGFEVGVHGLKHDGRLFSSHAEFMRRTEHINHHLEEFGAVGFRAPLTHRQPEWMQALDIEYDLTFFDTDPYEPIPGGTMSIWPYFLGRFVELPYTLAQDCTLTIVLGETTPWLWLQKVDFIEQYHGMALVNAHPDYFKHDTTRKVYADFLQAMKERAGYWHALPREVARWWRGRASGLCDGDVQGAVLGRVVLEGNRIALYVG